MPCAAPPCSWASTIVGLIGATGIVDDRVREQTDLARLHVHLDRRGLRAEGPGDGVGIEVGARVQTRLAGRLERLRFHGRVRDAAETHVALGHADDVHAALLDAHVLGRALQHLGGHLRGARPHLARGLRDGGPGVGGDAAAAGAHPVRKHRGVPRQDLHVLPGGAELGGGDLGERGVVALPLRGHADVDVDLAARIDAHGGALVGTEPRALRVAAEAHADPPRGAGARLLAPPPLVVVQERQRALEGRRESRRGRR